MVDKTVEDLTEDADPNRLTIAVEGEGWLAVANPSFNVGRDGAHDYTGSPDGSPFPYKVVGDHPPHEEVEGRLRDRLTQGALSIRDCVREADDPLDAVLNMDIQSKLDETADDP